MTCAACGKPNPEGETRCVHCLRALQANPAPTQGREGGPPPQYSPPITFNPQGSSVLPSRGSLSERGAASPNVQRPPINLGYPVVCRVCGHSILGGQKRCSRCRVPAGMIIDPNDPSGSNFLVVDPEVVAAHNPGRRR